MQTELRINFYINSVDLLLLWGRKVQWRQTVNDFNNWVEYQKAKNLSNNNSTFVSSFYTDAFSGNNCLHAKSSYK